MSVTVCSTVSLQSKFQLVNVLKLPAQIKLAAELNPDDVVDGIKIATVRRPQINVKNFTKFLNSVVSVFMTHIKLQI